MLIAKPITAIARMTSQLPFPQSSDGVQASASRHHLGA